MTTRMDVPVGMIFKTTSFTIRCYTLADVDELARSFGRPEILRPVRGRSGRYTRADARKYIKKKMRQYQRKNLAHQKGSESRGYAIERQGQLIGGVGFTDFGDTAEIGYWLAKPHWGQGIMTQVIRELMKYLRKKYGYRKFQAKVFPFNLPSARVLQKNGFHFDVRVVNSVRMGRRFLDDLVFVKNFPDNRPNRCA